MEILEETIRVIRSTLNVDTPINQEVQLLGGMPEFDSQAVVAIITNLEEQLGIFIEDDEITAEVFETVGSLVDFLKTKM